MAVWETDSALAEGSPESAKFAATCQAADKVVFSSTLAQVHTRRTRVEQQLDAQVVAEIKAAGRGDLTIGGPTLAAEALRLDLVDVVELLWFPVMLRQRYARELEADAVADGWFRRRAARRR